MHAGVAVHSAARAVADELGDVSGAEYAAAVSVGLDVAVRLALAPTQDFGWHRTVESQAHVAKGNPLKPLTAADIETKALDCNAFAGKPLSDAAVRDIIATALAVRNLGSTTELTAKLSLA